MTFSIRSFDENEKENSRRERPVQDFPCVKFVSVLDYRSAKITDPPHHSTHAPQRQLHTGENWQPTVFHWESVNFRLDRMNWLGAPEQWFQQKSNTDVTLRQPAEKRVTKQSNGTCGVLHCACAVFSLPGRLALWSCTCLSESGVNFLNFVLRDWKQNSVLFVSTTHLILSNQSAVTN